MLPSRIERGSKDPFRKDEEVRFWASLYIARVIIDILGISEVKWTGMGKLNSDDHYIYYCGQEPLRRNGVVIMVNNRV